MHEPPICTALAPIIFNENVTENEGYRVSEGVPEYPLCKGSDCHLWVPEMVADKVSDSGVISVWDTYPMDRVPGYELPRPEGSGRCALNLRREPWWDPALAEEE